MPTCPLTRWHMLCLSATECFIWSRTAASLTQYFNFARPFRIGFRFDIGDMATESGYTTFGLTLSQGQKETLAKAAHVGGGVTIRLTVDQLHGEDKLALTKRQIAHITKKKGEHAGAELKFSKTQIKKMTKMGAFCRCLRLFP